MTEELKPCPELVELQTMISKSRHPQMDSSHILDSNRALKLILLINNKWNTRHQSEELKKCMELVNCLNEQLVIKSENHKLSGNEKELKDYCDLILGPIQEPKGK